MLGMCGHGWGRVAQGEQKTLRGNTWLLVPVQPLPPGATLHKSPSEVRPVSPHVDKVTFKFASSVLLNLTSHWSHE